MALLPVKYTNEIKTKVDAYNNKPPSEQCGSYWDIENDAALTKVKKHIKEHYIRHQDYTCPYCQQRFEVLHNGVWDTEHIIPKDKFPQFLFKEENLCVACKDCNVAKTNKHVLVNKQRKTFPKSSKDYLLVHPHFDKYESHIKILKSSLFFIPTDEKGKNTIEICGLLRFLYKFSEYGNVNLDVKLKINELSNELLNASSPIVENFILACISDLAEHGKSMSKNKALGID